MKIKICGLSRPCDIEYVNRYKPDFVGFIINFPKSHRNIGLCKVKELYELLSHDIAAVGVTVNQPFEFNKRLLCENIVDIVQLHGDENEEYISRLKVETGKPVWKAFKIRTNDDLQRAKQSCADMILLDNGYGTGETFDWTLVGDIGRPFALAGGLTAENLVQAAEIKPFIVDISGGAETDKLKDEKKIKKLIDIARRLP